MKTAQLGLSRASSILLAQLLLVETCLPHDTPLHSEVTQAAALASVILAGKAEDEEEKENEDDSRWSLPHYCG